ncbi:MAG: helix-hairpin-helix domain-containing protein, partial [Bacteroidota bacterium]
MRRFLFATWLIIVMSRPVHAQEMEVPDSNRARLLYQTEKLLEDVTQDATDSQLADLLARLEENPLDLNYATEAKLRQIPGITQSVAYRIIAARTPSGFQSIAEIRHIDGMTDDLYEIIRKFTTITSSEVSGNMVGGSLRSRTVSDLQDRRGYLDGTYRGSSLKSYQRLILNYGEPRSRTKKNNRWVETGFLVEKDAGETRLNDFQAGYAMVNAPEISSKVILGDFVVEAAEGLVLWRSIGFSKGSEVVSTLEKSGGGIRPYLSTDENLFFRGGAFEWESDGVLLSAFYSNKKMTASINANGMITSLIADGYHRTASEEAKMDNAKESLLGFRTSFEFARGLSFGATAFQANFSHPLLIGGTEASSGTRMRAGGLDFRYSDKRLTLFSEIATSTSG